MLKTSITSHFEPGYFNEIYLLQKLPIDPRLYFKALFEGYCGVETNFTEFLSGETYPSAIEYTKQTHPYATQLHSELTTIFGGDLEMLRDIFELYGKNGFKNIIAIAKLHKAVKRQEKQILDNKAHV